MDAVKKSGKIFVHFLSTFDDKTVQFAPNQGK